MLRNEVGDNVFRQIIQTFYHQYKGGNADTRDFEAVAEKVSGKELTPFFDQWLYQPGIPKLEVRWKSGINEVRVRQVQETLFRFPLEILLTSKQKTQQLIKLNITQKEQTFQIPGSSNGKSISLDPNTSLLFSGSIITEAKPGLRKKQKSL
jgi:aminopeptidase N